MVLADKPVINDDTNNLDPALLKVETPSPPPFSCPCLPPPAGADDRRSLDAQELLENIGTLASVYHKPPDSFVSRARLAVTKGDDLETHRFDDSEDGIGAPPVRCQPAPAVNPARSALTAPVSNR